METRFSDAAVVLVCCCCVGEGEGLFTVVRPGPVTPRHLFSFDIPWLADDDNNLVQIELNQHHEDFIISLLFLSTFVGSISRPRIMTRPTNDGTKMRHRLWLLEHLKIDEEHFLLFFSYRRREPSHHHSLHALMWQRLQSGR